MPEPTDENKITWGRNERGDLLIDDVVVERNTFFQGDATSEVPEDDESVPDRTNAAVEATVAEAEVPKAPEQPAPTEKEVVPEPAKIPEKQKFKLMVRGEWQEKEYSPEEMVARLQMAESYDLRNDELRKKHREIEPFVHLFDRPEFKALIEEKMATGELPAPVQPPPVQGEEVIRYRLNTADPEFTEIRTQMSAWAATLSDAETEILNTSHKAFNDAYDRFKANRRVSATPTSVVPNRGVEKAIAAKEVIKAQAKVESPGVAPQEVDPAKQWEKEYVRLRTAVRNGEKWVHYKGRRMDADTAWVMHRMEKD